MAGYIIYHKEYLLGEGGWLDDSRTVIFSEDDLNEIINTGSGTWSLPPTHYQMAERGRGGRIDPIGEKIPIDWW